MAFLFRTKKKRSTLDLFAGDADAEGVSVSPATPLATLLELEQCLELGSLTSDIKCLTYTGDASDPTDTEHHSLAPGDFVEANDFSSTVSYVRQRASPPLSLTRSPANPRALV